ncbi:hypothetical protein [Embleya sp. NPDC005971]|uniref:hypothetical protein n=1 Tax=Embleya sp. NPDC005971 TaxID=3156724 RepID=UPI0033E19E90
MGKQFTAFVHVDNGDGKSQVFSPGDPMPEWAEAHVKNPKVWSDDGHSPATQAPPAGESEEGPVEPPRSGPGSGKSAWAEYASARGVTVANDASREDIIAAVDAASKVG